MKYTATTIKDGRKHRGLVMRADGSSAYEGPPRHHKSAALSDAQRTAESYNSTPAVQSAFPAKRRLRVKRPLQTRAVEALNRAGLSDMHGQFYPEANAHNVTRFLLKKFRAETA